MENIYRYNTRGNYSRLPEQNRSTDCVTTALPDNTVPTMAYIPFQLDKTAYTPDMALREGTLFPILNKPFCGRSVANG